MHTYSEDLAVEGHLLDNRLSFLSVGPHNQAACLALYGWSGLVVGFANRF